MAEGLLNLLCGDLAQIQYAIKYVLYPLNRIARCNLKELSPIQRLTLLALAHHANNTTLESFPSQDKIAKFSGFNRQNTNVAIQKLAELGYIIFLPKKGKNNVYKLTMKGEPKNESTGSKNEKHNVANSTNYPRNSSIELDTLPDWNSSLDEKINAIFARG